MTPLKGWVLFEGRLRCRTGLHLGALPEMVEGSLADAPIIRDPATGRPQEPATWMPYIPGSALRGKLRWLLERSRFDGSPTFFPEVARAGGLPIRVHTCPGCPICRLFGPVPREGEELHAMSLLVVENLPWEPPDSRADQVLERLIETKAENAVDRGTGAANPRILERVSPGEPNGGTAFRLRLRYQVRDPATLQEDLDHLLLTLSLLEDDALGGQGSRGSGAVEIEMWTIDGRAIAYYGARDQDNEKFQRRCFEGPGTLEALKARWEQILRELTTLFQGKGDGDDMGGQM